MPIYEYECTACGHKLEAFQSMSEGPLTDCPECQAAALKKCVTAAAFQLKGSGWYVTDFKDQKKPASKTNDAKGKDGGKESATTDKKGTSKKDHGDKAKTAGMTATKSESSD